MFFKLPWLNKRKAPAPHDTQVLELDFLVDEFHAAMADIQDPLRARLHAALMNCLTPRDLWFLRGKLFNLICKHHHEGEANRRIARLDAKLRFFVENHPDYDADELPSKPMALMH